MRFLAVAAALLLAAGAAFAHGEGPPLTFWGNFGSGAAECQRALGASTRQCVARVWQARLGCFRDGCEPGSVDAALQAGRQRIRDIVQRVCTDQEVRLLQFAGLSEALVDAREGCRTLDTAYDSAVFGPLQRAELGPEDLACVELAAARATALIRATLASRARLLDYIATADLDLPDKNQLIARSAAQIADATGAASLPSPACPAPRFEQLYGRGLEAFCALLATRADCFAGTCYTQSTLVCPAPTCGNGMREPGETCDDGNTEGGDSCSATCGIAASLLR